MGFAGGMGEAAGCIKNVEHIHASRMLSRREAVHCTSLSPFEIRVTATAHSSQAVQPYMNQTTAYLDS